jgi:ribosomal protein S8
MVGLHLCEFAAAFNYAVSTKRRSFRVHSIALNRAITFYLRKTGYIVGFRRRNGYLEIFPYYGHVRVPRVTAVSTPSRPIFFGPHKIRKELRGGNRYILFSHSGSICDSYDCLLANKGGQALLVFA